MRHYWGGGGRVEKRGSQKDRNKEEKGTEGRMIENERGERRRYVKDKCMAKEGDKKRFTDKDDRGRKPRDEKAVMAMSIAVKIESKQESHERDYGDRKRQQCFSPFSVQRSVPSIHCQNNVRSCSRPLRDNEMRHASFLFLNLYFKCEFHHIILIQLNKLEKDDDLALLSVHELLNLFSS
jgi:hypothetical protein